MREAFRALGGQPDALFLLGYLLLPLLGLISAGLGLWLVLTDRVVGGLVVLLVVTQAFAFGALWIAARRRRLLDADPARRA